MGVADLEETAVPSSMKTKPPCGQEFMIYPLVFTCSPSGLHLTPVEDTARFPKVSRALDTVAK